ncbi:hypothetical protein ACFFX0_21195 [Citricoccus parietis]|uniref:Uncharacterized protein n=1 Tax=Citricoccus parietis TaxID=592307 RepID=A0ABV5G3R3_9MICC
MRQDRLGQDIVGQHAKDARREPAVLFPAPRSRCHGAERVRARKSQSGQPEELFRSSMRNQQLLQLNGVYIYGAIQTLAPPPSSRGVA